MTIHPSKDIRFSKSRLLSERRIALGICGSVGAIRCPELARALMRHGADVFVFMTKASQQLISPALMEWATGNPVVTEITGGIEHVALGGGVPGCADLVLVAPATANSIGKIASGIDDTPVTTLVTTAIGAGLPIILAPAMHQSMYRHPAVADNIQRLKSMGVTVILPEMSEGKAKAANNHSIVDAVICELTPKDLSGRKVLVTAGPTRSYMDAIRYITNPSTGTMGVALALDALSRGAKVTLVIGPVDACTDIPGLDVIKVVTTTEMLEAVLSELRSGSYDLLVMAAAPLDFGFTYTSAGKIPTSGLTSDDSPFSLSLTPLPKITKEARKISPETFIIGFKAEYGLAQDELFRRAQARLAETGMDLIVANDLSRPGIGFGLETNEVYVLDRGGVVGHLPIAPKREIARKILSIYLGKVGSR